MTPEELAALHRVAFTQDRPWSCDEFTCLLENKFTSLIEHPQGFALVQTLAGETELLTLAVSPHHQRQGIGRSLTTQWLLQSELFAQSAFLEVAADNTAAIALYGQIGFKIAATRKGYYRRQGSAAVDALVMQRKLTHGKANVSEGDVPEIG